MQEDHVGMLGIYLIEAIPDEVVVIEVEPAGECDFRSWWQHDLSLRTTLGGNEVAESIIAAVSVR